MAAKLWLPHPCGATTCPSMPTELSLELFLQNGCWHKTCLCPHCYQLVANSRHSTHLQRCTQSQIFNISHSLPLIRDSQTNQELPTFAEVCQLNHPTLRFVPAKARPAFARALSSTLKDILLHNTEEAWLKLFMLPKCVLPSLKYKGVTSPHTTIESLCKLWLDNDLITLWAMAKKQGQ